MNEYWPGAFAFAAFCAMFAYVSTSDSGDMGHNERLAYEAYLEICVETGITPEPPCSHTSSENTLPKLD